MKKEAIKTDVDPTQTFIRKILEHLCQRQKESNFNNESLFLPLPKGLNIIALI